jgi:hypothetical protein
MNTEFWRRNLLRNIHLEDREGNGEGVMDLRNVVREDGGGWNYVRITLLSVVLNFLFWCCIIS